jgi:hypothetical protein
MRYLKFFIVVTLMGAVVLYSSCGGGDPKPELTAQQKAAKALSANTWGGLNKVNVDVHPSGLLPEHYAGVKTLKLTFKTDASNNPASFIAEGGGNIFPDFNGNWSWSGTGKNTITISGGDITILNDFSFLPGEENPNSIKFTFNSQCSSCRTSDVTGDYTVILEK